MKQYVRALTIAGSDPSGGAGLQADLKTFSALGCYGMSAVTAVVDENTVGVSGVHAVPDSFVRGQIESCIDDIGVDAIKIGMLHSSSLILTVADVLGKYGVGNIVLDPVMVATSGDPLLEGDAVATLTDVLIPRVRVITPNIPEAEILLGRAIAGSAVLGDAAVELARKCGVSVLLKGGHLEDGEVMDVLCDATTMEVSTFTSQRISTPNTHGTGCTMSSAVAAYLAHGLPLVAAVAGAKDYIAEAIRRGSEYRIGHGHGPVMHFYNFWD